jgi:valyl-tRNA synthetase
MGARYESWVQGLNGDWCISRQRFFGVPLPVWYTLDDQGSTVYDDPILPEEGDLPIDPMSDVPDGYLAEQRGVPGGFVGDPDIMDTWATSSLTPQIAGGWEEDDDLFARVFPMDLRPQAHDIIRTWLFYTVLKAELEHGTLPWSHAAISGFITDPDRKKMSKSKGNVVTPIQLLEQYGTDAVRYWSARARLGMDAVFKEEQIRIGRRLAIKILNASKFTLSIEAGTGEVIEPLDRSMLESLAQVVEEATAALNDYEHARALDAIERFFWGFTDDYVELVKQRAYGSRGPESARSAVGALRTALDVLLRLFAPFLPYVTEEVWSWWKEGSIHRAEWPTTDPLVTSADPDVYAVAAAVLSAVRKEKALAKVSLKVAVDRVIVRDSADRLKLLQSAEADLCEAGNIGVLETIEAEEFSVETVLAMPESA